MAFSRSVGAIEFGMNYRPSTTNTGHIGARRLAFWPLKKRFLNGSRSTTFPITSLICLGRFSITVARSWRTGYRILLRGIAGYYHFAGRIDWFQSDFQTYERVPNDDEWIVRRDMWRTYALEASILALHRAIWWRPFPEEDYDAVDIGDRLDAHAIAALDWCDDSRKASLQRAYWLHWLHDLFPKVLASIDDVRRAVSPE